MNNRIDSVVLGLSTQAIDRHSAKESTLLLDTVAYKFPHASIVPPQKFEVKARVTKMTRSASFYDPFTLSSCSVVSVLSQRAKPIFMLDYKVLEESENSEGRFETWLVFSENLSGARVVFSKEVPWAPELLEFRFNPKRSAVEKRKVVTVSDLKSWNLLRRTSSKWTEVQPGQIAPMLVRQDADGQGNRTTTEYSFKNFKKISKEDRELLREENFTADKLLGGTDFQKIFELFEGETSVPK
ncbi:hypothetical protein SH467x_003361 [Pirellulaceae bacterium SH467]